ncbi:ABC transporter ATP-binding protein [Pseudomonas psychrotolerans]|uniref:ABC transporter ATP-binding protein n=1 Tax=Pseudomonas oryzihabitans TaxID=47885 RepID=UPI0015E2D6D0|nr:ABC transporter ATP-binding protein [Pseudomonas psychrotolerans]MBA1181623.1 ABC transporter ATP-binding protein [Pseudomonas psychrotolerans]MBA1213103.1 ABC transporter ATP-binding protein [Pseudomonas psychrotolerans]
MFDSSSSPQPQADSEAHDDYGDLARRHVTPTRIISLLAPHRAALILVVLLIAVAGISGVISPFLIRSIVDDALPAKDLRLLVYLAAGLVGVALFNAIANLTQTYVSIRVGQSVMHDLRTRLYGHLQNLSLAFFSGTRAGEVQARLSSDIAGLQTLLTNSATDLAKHLSVVAATLAAMLLLDWRLACASLAVMPLLIWINGRVAQLRERVTYQQQEQVADLSANIAESLSAGGIILSRTMGRVHYLVQRFQRDSAQLARLETQAGTAGQWEFAIVFLALDLLPALTFLGGGLFIGLGLEVSIGTLVAFIALQEQLLWPLLEIFETRIEFAKGRALLARVFSYLDTPATVVEASPPRSLARQDLQQGIRFENVGFAYGERAVLKNLTLEIPAGKHTALVGPTGSGKTTISYLIARLYDVDQGRICYDGIDIRELSFATLADLVGIVTQDTFLLNASIKDNLRFAKPDASEEELWRALERAQLDTMVRRLPDGLDAGVGDRGYQLSGGERQRLSLARMLLRDPPIILLDEATSALDSTTQAAMANALACLQGPRTLISIAHRLSTVREADQILVIQDGRLVEQGTHQELVGQNGLYAAMA